MRAKDIIKEIVYSLRNRKYFRFYSSQFKHYMELRGFVDTKAPGEDDYVEKWRVLSKRVDPYSYRFFSHFCGYTPRIIPEDIGRTIIEDVLCPVTYRGVYSDKNLFPMIVGKENLPRMLLSRINGGCLLDSDYHPVEKDILDYLNNADSIIIKPTVRSYSGRNIKKFERKGDSFVSVDSGSILTKDLLMSYMDDFCVQESIVQHDLLNSLCPTSVNTIRLCLYRSVNNDSPIVTAAVLRIGKDGKYVDNAHAGGMFTGIDINTGKLASFVIDQYGSKSTVWNGIDFSKESFVIPNWDDILSFAQEVGRRILHHRLIALDIALRKDGSPVLIEYNLGQFSYWLFMYTNQEVFGEYTDEVIEYCRAQYPKLKQNFKNSFGYMLREILK